MIDADEEREKSDLVAAELDVARLRAALAEIRLPLPSAAEAQAPRRSRCIVNF